MKSKKKNKKEKIWKWWSSKVKLPNNVRWKTLRHHGPLFPEPYKRLPKEAKFFYKGKLFHLSKLAEEAAGFYAKMLYDPYTKNKTFNKNFFLDWKSVMTASERHHITKLKYCNFKKMHEFFVNSRSKKMTPFHRKALEHKQKHDLSKYGFCYVDGHRQKVGNFKIEPPSIFRGRGNHPLRGKLKKRIIPSDVIINISRGTMIPKPSVRGAWKAVVHINKVTWLASWCDNISETRKYTLLGPSSKFRAEKDYEKFETARRLGKIIKKIRTRYRNEIQSDDIVKAQRAVALFFIDKLALRIGGEKTKESADTIGCMSIRIEHIWLMRANQKNFVILHFPAKDSIKYKHSFEVHKRIFNKIKSLTRNKTRKDKLFDAITPSMLNDYLETIMDGLTAKVFRTYNSCKLFESCLETYTAQRTMTEQEKLAAYKTSNREVALLCNHRKAESKSFKKNLHLLKSKINSTKKKERNLYRKMNKLANAKIPATKKLHEKYVKQHAYAVSRVKALELKKTDKMQYKDVNLATSKLNYIDPRITFAWCHRSKIPIEKVFNKTEREKFQWAFQKTSLNFIF